jgi:peptidoglycan-associated lipoprotein
MTNLELSQNRAQSVVDYLISKGIFADRLFAKGYGPDVPRVADEKIAALYSFLKTGDTLSKGYIDKLPNDQDKEIAHQLNRRTEFRVLRNDYVPGGKPGNEIDAQQQILLRGMEELQQGQRNRAIPPAGALGKPGGRPAGKPGGKPATGGRTGAVIKLP